MAGAKELEKCISEADSGGVADSLHVATMVATHWVLNEGVRMSFNPATRAGGLAAAQQPLRLPTPESLQ